MGPPDARCASPDQRSLALGITAVAGGHELSQRLAKVETAIFRQKTITFDYYTMERDETGARKVDPYHLLFRGGQFYLLGRSHERERAPRLPALADPRQGRLRDEGRARLQAPDRLRPARLRQPRRLAVRRRPIGIAEIAVAERIAWQVERHFGRFGEIAPAEDGGVVFATAYATPASSSRGCCGLGEHARVVGPPELVAEVGERVALLAERHEGELAACAARSPRARRAEDDDGAADGNGRREAAIRPERFARLVTLASILIEAGRAGERLREAEVCERLQITDAELREDINVLNVVNFGGGSYVLYAEISDDGTIEVDPEPYSDNFARPARLLPVEAKALVAAIDLIGEHLPEGALTSAREKIVAALGADPIEQGLQVAAAGADDSEIARVVSEAIAARRLLKLDYYKANEDEFSERIVEPYALVNGREGWYVASFDPEQGRRAPLPPGPRQDAPRCCARRFTPRPEVDPAADVEGWPRTGEVPASRTARVWISPERARWAREERTVAQELADGSVIVELQLRRRRTGWCARCSRRPATPPSLEPAGRARRRARGRAAGLRNAARAA